MSKWQTCRLLSLVACEEHNAPWLGLCPDRTESYISPSSRPRVRCKCTHWLSKVTRDHSTSGARGQDPHSVHILYAYKFSVNNNSFIFFLHESPRSICWFRLLRSDYWWVTTNLESVLQRSNRIYGGQIISHSISHQDCGESLDAGGIGPLTLEINWGGLCSAVASNGLRWWWWW